MRYHPYKSKSRATKVLFFFKGYYYSKWPKLMIAEYLFKFLLHLPPTCEYYLW